MQRIVPLKYLQWLVFVMMACHSPVVGFVPSFRCLRTSSSSGTRLNADNARKKNPRVKIKSQHCPSNNRKSKNDLEAIVKGMGLTPSISRKKRKSSKQEDGIPNVSLQTQLHYARNGHAAIRSFLDPALLQEIMSDLLQYSSTKALEAWRQKVEVAADSTELAQSCNSVEQCIQELDRLKIQWDSLPFLQHFNTWRSVPRVHSLAVSLGKIAATLLDVPSVKLYQDSLFCKRSQDGPTPWHTDARMAPFDTSNFITFWIPLQRVPQDGTALLFVSKSHSDFALPFWNDFETGKEWNRLEERYGSNAVDYMPMNVGDITVHSGWTLHCANGNSNEEERLALAISYVDEKAEIRADIEQSSSSNGGGYGDNEDYWSYKDWVFEVPPRQQFQHELVPIVWPPQDS